MLLSRPTTRLSATIARVAKNAIQRINDRSHGDFEGRSHAQNPWRLPIERARFEFNAAREALNHHATLGKITTDSTQDDEAKIQAAREMIFGKELIARVDANDPLRRKSP